MLKPNGLLNLKTHVALDENITLKPSVVKLVAVQCNFDATHWQPNDKKDKEINVFLRKRP